MSPLTQKLLNQLHQEKDMALVKEVIDFYFFLKVKQKREDQKKWSNIEEVEPDHIDIQMIHKCKNDDYTDAISIDKLLQELGFDESEI